MLEKLKENETKIEILYIFTLLIYFLGLVNLSRFKNEIIDILVMVNIFILFYVMKKPWAKNIMKHLLHFYWRCLSWVLLELQWGNIMEDYSTGGLRRELNILHLKLHPSKPNPQ